MDTKRPLMAGSLAGAFLCASVVYAFIAAFLAETRIPTEPPEWIVYVRLTSVILTGVTPFLALFIARQIRIAAAERLSQRGRDPN